MEALLLPLNQRAGHVLRPFEFIILELLVFVKDIYEAHYKLLSDLDYLRS